MRHLRVFAVLAAGLCALTFAAGASAATPSGTHLFTCAFAEDGQTTVPAGTPVQVWMAQAYSNRGRLNAFLAAQHVTATVDGVPIDDGSASWSAPAYEPDAGAWASFWTYDAGVLANPGDSLTLAVQVSLDHRIGAGYDPEGGALLDGPGDLYPEPVSCTITAT